MCMTVGWRNDQDHKLVASLGTTLDTRSAKKIYLRVFLPLQVSIMASQSLDSTSANQALTTDDLAQLESTLHGVAHNATAFGLQLGVNDATIRTIRVQYASPNDQLREILSYRLRQLPALTWLDIIRALQSNSMQENRLASDIESQLLSASASSQVTSAHPSAALPSTLHSGPQSTLQSNHLTPNTQPHPPPQPVSPSQVCVLVVCTQGRRKIKNRIGHHLGYLIKSQ